MRMKSLSLAYILRGRKAIPGVTGKLIADAVESKAIGKNVRYCEHREDLIVFLRELLVEGDLCLTLGAGRSYEYRRPANGSIRRWSINGQKFRNL